MRAYAEKHGITDVVACRVHTALLGLEVQGSRVLIVQDVTSAKVLVDAAVESVRLHRRVIARLNKHLFRRIERATWGLYDGLAVVSADEQAAAKNVDPGLSVTVVPNGVKEWPEGPSTGTPVATGETLAVAYVGSLGSARNEDAVWLLATQIMPQVWLSAPELKLRVIGAPPSKRLKQLAETDGRIELLGFVESIRPHLDNAICVNPQQVGSGIKNSILLPLSLGSPTVVSDVASAGIDGISGEHYVVCESVDEIVRAVVSLADDQVLRRSLSASAQLLARTRYSWDTYATAIERLLGLQR